MSSPKAVNAAGDNQLGCIAAVFFLKFSHFKPAPTSFQGGMLDSGDAYLSNQWPSINKWSVSSIPPS